MGQAGCRMIIEGDNRAESPSVRLNLVWPRGPVSLGAVNGLRVAVVGVCNVLVTAGGIEMEGIVVEEYCGGETAALPVELALLDAEMPAGFGSGGTGGMSWSSR